MNRFTFCFLLLSLGSTVAFAHADTPVVSSDPYPVLPLFQKKITLKAGTLVLFETTNSLNSRGATIGSLVSFRVTTNVTTEGRTVIAAGTHATGRVTRITKSTYNEPEVIQVEVKYVLAVDGTQVHLSTNPLDVKAQFTGEGAVVQPLTPASSMVMNDTDITVN